MTNINVPKYIMRDSPFGRLLIAATGQGICYAALADTDRQLLPDLYADFPTAQPASNGVVSGWADALAAYLGGAAPEPNLPLDLRGTPFQQKVWKALCKIPRGETQTYTWLGQPG